MIETDSRRCFAKKSVKSEITLRYPLTMLLQYDIILSEVISMIKGSRKPDSKDYMLRVRMTEEDKIWLEYLRQYYGVSSASEFVRHLIMEQKERMDKEIAESEKVIEQLKIDDFII